MDWEKFLAIWGASLSSILATFQILEKIRSRSRIYIDRVLYGSPDRADKIIITNVGNNKIIVRGYDIYIAKTRFSKKRRYFDSGDRDEDNNFEIQANSKFILVFREQYKFPTVKKEEHLFLKLNLIGRSERIFKIF